MFSVLEGSRIKVSKCVEDPALVNDPPSLSVTMSLEAKGGEVAMAVAGLQQVTISPAAQRQSQMEIL